MVDIDFDLNQSHTIIQANLTDQFQQVINKYLTKALLNPDSVCFIANGKQVNPSEAVQNHMSNLDKDQKKLKVLVNMFESDRVPEEVIIKSEEIICPQCKEPCLIALEGCKIKLYECPKKHKNKEINIVDFENTQKINISKIICDNCKIKNKGNCPKNDFYKCLSCNHNLCLICRPNHNSSHNVIRYDQKNYICHNHNEHLISYCKECNKNICYSCEGHEEHETIALKELKPNIEEKKCLLKEMKAIIETLELKIKEAINILNEFSVFIKKFYDINNSIVSNYDAKNRNYQVLQNVKGISNNTIIYNKLKDIKVKDDINDIIKMYRSIKENKEIYEDKKENNNMYGNIEKKNKENINNKNQNAIIYNILNKDEIKIFGSTFVDNNKNKCNIIIDGQKQSLCSYLKLNPNQKKERILQIELQGIQNITNMSSMFYNCKSLISLPVISVWDTKKVTNMKSMFNGCSSLISLPDISMWNTNNVTDMSYMFCDCSSLSSLPDISKWNTNNVKDMSHMFNYCESLISLPDFSEWKINKNLKKEGMFEGVNINIIPKKFK